MEMPKINTEKLMAIVWRIVSDETVEDIHEMADKIEEAADIFVRAGMRILGLENDARALPDEDVERVLAEYQE